MKKYLEQLKAEIEQQFEENTKKLNELQITQIKLSGKYEMLKEIVSNISSSEE